MIRSSLIVISGLVIFITTAFGATSREQAMIDRLSPIGSVCMAGDACAAAAVASASAGPRSGETVYNGTCMACHATGASNAPIVGNHDLWAPRIAKGKEALYSSALNGVSVDGVMVMPVKGLCLDCTEEEIKSVVDYMVSASQ